VYAGATHAIEPLIDHVLSDGFEVSYPVLYPANQVHSPISEDIVAGLSRFSDINGVVQNDVFAKAGDSKLVSNSALNCFAGSNIDLDVFFSLQSTLDHFRAGSAAGSSPFDRASQATGVGRTAFWLISGGPSPLEQEITALWPRFTLIAFGENDMSLMNLDQFANSLLDAVDYILSKGSIPVIYSSAPCRACTGGTEKVELYRRIARATAQFRQVPFVDLYFALGPLPDDGIGSDGIHMNTYNPGSSSPCILTSAGLDYGYNMFNLVSLQMLDRLSKAMVLQEEAPDTTVTRRVGDGSLADPIVVNQFPYNDGYKLNSQGPDEVNSFTACSVPADTAGHELIYKLDFDAPAALRVDLISRDPADLDVWLFEGSTNGENCVTKEHKTLEVEVDAGTWYLVVESFRLNETLLDGEYILSMDID